MREFLVAYAGREAPVAASYDSAVSEFGAPDHVFASDEVDAVLEFNAGCDDKALPGEVYYVREIITSPAVTVLVGDHEEMHAVTVSS